MLQSRGSITIDPICDVTPAVTTTYTVEVGCQAMPGCIDSADVTVEVIPFPEPILGSLGPICVGDSVTLDASATDPRGCAVALDYRFLEGPTEIRPWGPSPSHGPLAPGASTSYTVEARCTVAPGCTDTTSTSLDVVALPTAAAGVDVGICEMVPTTLDASGSVDPGCPGGLEYEWREGANVERPWDADPTWNPPTTTAGSTTYTVYVRCVGPPGCEHSDDVVVRVDRCALAVDYDRYGARLVELDGVRVVEVSWRTLLEDGTIGFLIERASAASGPYVTLDGVAPIGANRDYSFIDSTFDPTAGIWYRVVELTEAGRGDQTPPFTLDGQDEAVSTGGRRRGSTRR